MRGLDAATITALQGDHDRAHLITLGFSTPVRLTDYGADVEYDSNTYNSTGHVLGVDALKETGELRVNQSTMRLDGADQTYISLMLNQNYSNIDVTILCAIITGGSIQGTPYTVFDGQLVGVDIEDNGDDSEVMLSLSNHWRDFEKTNGMRTTLGSHQRVFSGDKFFEFATDQNREIVWGRR